MNHQHLSHDYRSSMQRAATAYLQRHADQYLADSDRLFDNCVHHLTVAMDVPVFLAQRLVHDAWSELHQEPLANFVGIDWGVGSDATVVCLIDIRSGQRYPVPARLLPQRLLDQRNAAITPRPQ
ncbi:hypothetical protein HX870_24445 [Pseudomonas gingeri]|uniref:hypothetical protein n=1 Tax=Pseudomonas gingeri TaxID=117681 RepID=UPI0015A1364A|nr:hypothetical protein [Pseudomonas gingeri]NWD70753.1 hypothetical protein [Pseudomonas gingeri]